MSTDFELTQDSRFENGERDGARTRDLRRDRRAVFQAFLSNSKYLRPKKAVCFQLRPSLILNGLALHLAQLLLTLGRALTAAGTWLYNLTPKGYRPPPRCTWDHSKPSWSPGFYEALGRQEWERYRMRRHSRRNKKPRRPELTGFVRDC
jgi:hypothetical protein